MQQNLAIHGMSSRVFFPNPNKETGTERAESKLTYWGEAGWEPGWSGTGNWIENQEAESESGWRSQEVQMPRWSGRGRKCQTLWHSNEIRSTIKQRQEPLRLISSALDQGERPPSFFFVFYYGVCQWVDNTLHEGLLNVRLMASSSGWQRGRSSPLGRTGHFISSMGTLFGLWTFHWRDPA